MSNHVKANIPLKSIQWKGEVDGPLFRYQSVQNYENTTDDTIEISYSFPLPYGKSVITSFSAEINGVVRHACALPKKKAEETYENAMESGDSPVMLKIEEQDFCTASLGNLKPGEKAKITVEYMQLLEFHGKKVRITIPMVLDERYAASEESYPSPLAGVEANIFADYVCSGELLVKKPFDEGTVYSPSHAIRCSYCKEGLKVGAVGKADRDFVVDLEVESSGVLCLAQDGKEWAALASFIPQIAPKKAPLDLCVLLDCSGSMDGSRIKWAKETLSKIVGGLDPQDQVTLYRFGSDLRLAKIAKNVTIPECNSRIKEWLTRPWGEVIKHIQADLGGTELAGALNGCTDLCRGESENSAILLITDGEVWDTKSVKKAAKKTGRRIFTLGIGMAPYGSLLTEISESTGGVYESVYSYSDIEDAANSVIVRLQAPLLKSVSVHWPQDAIWTSRAPRTVYSADSCSSAAFLREPIDELRMSFLEDGQKQEITIKRLDQESGKALVQLVANMRMVASKDAEEQEYIGIRYNLAGPRTNFLLVVERAEEDKVADFAKLSVVPQMPVADRMCSVPLGGLGKVGDISYCMTEPIRKCSRASHLGHWHASRATRHLGNPLEMWVDVDKAKDTDRVESMFFYSETEEVVKQLMDSKDLAELWKLAQEVGDLEEKNSKKVYQKLRELSSSRVEREYKERKAVWNLAYETRVLEDKDSRKMLQKLIDLSSSRTKRAQQLNQQLTFLTALYRFMEMPGKQTLSLFNELRKADERLNERWPELRDFAKYMRKEHASWLTEQFQLFDAEWHVPEALADIVQIPTLQEWDNTDERNFVDAILTMLFVVNFVLDSENKEEQKEL